MDDDADEAELRRLLAAALALADTLELTMVAIHLGAAHEILGASTPTSSR